MALDDTANVRIRVHAGQAKRELDDVGARARKVGVDMWGAGRKGKKAAKDVQNAWGQVSTSFSANRLQRGMQRLHRATSRVTREARLLGQSIHWAANQGHGVARAMLRVGAAARIAGRGVRGLGRGIRGGVNALGHLESGMMSMMPLFTAAAAGTSAVAAGLTLAVREAARLDSAMSRVEAVTRAGPEAMAAMRGQAQYLGATTSFTASEVASTQEAFGRAGFSTNEIQASTGSALNLARGTDISTGDAASMISTALRTFQLDASNASTVADTFSAATAASNIDATMLRESMKYIGPALAGLVTDADRAAGGAQLEAARVRQLREGAALTGALGNIGIQGSQAGTVVRGAMNQFNSNTGRDALQGLGVGVARDDGSLKSLSEIMRDISRRFDERGTGQADRLNALNQIFGTRASGAISQLMANPENLARLVDGLEDTSNAAANMALIMEDNLGGDLALATSAISGFGTQIGDALMPATRGATQGFTDFITTITQTGGTLQPIAAEYDNLATTVSRGLLDAYIAYGDFVANLIEPFDSEGAQRMREMGAEYVAQQGYTELDRVTRESDTAVARRQGQSQARLAEIRGQEGALRGLSTRGGSTAVVSQITEAFGGADAAGRALEGSELGGVVQRLQGGASLEEAGFGGRDGQEALRSLINEFFTAQRTEEQQARDEDIRGIRGEQAAAVQRVVEETTSRVAERQGDVGGTAANERAQRVAEAQLRAAEAQRAAANATADAADRLNTGAGSGTSAPGEQ